jgi:hypothetical protein
MRTAEIRLSSDEGTSGRLVVSTLPNSSDALELGARHKLVTLREARRYRYEFVLDADITHIQPAELFDADDRALRTGRLVPGETVGLVDVEIGTSSGHVLRGRFDVRSAKFSDESAFASMLADLAALSVEALHQGFAPGAGQFAGDAGATPRLLYQQFAILNSLLSGSDLEWAIAQVLGRPHTSWTSELESRCPGQALRGSSRLVSQLSRPGPRVRTPRGPLDTLPATLLVQRSEETLDTIPNRFVRFVLERWRALALSVVQSAETLSGAPRQRGLQTAQSVVDELDEVLGSPLFREVGRLTTRPGDNQVLRRREGYRQISAAAALIDGSLGLELDLDDPFLVSRRSIASLYEYWTFVRLAGAVARACGSPGVEGELFRASPSGMSLVLKAGAQTRMKFETTIDGQLVRADLFFNKEFSGAHSWTRPMRPDASLVLRRHGDREVWLHFDAKYKVDWQTPFATGEPGDEEDAERRGESKRTDLLKMHAYRDAIRASAGSYVLFPGSQPRAFAMNSEELLPGLGAFPLRPDRADEDVDALQAFISRALVHVAGAGTRHRRASFWEDRAYGGQGTLAPEASPPAGELPPADTAVLVGYVRSEAQWAWIRSAHLYNLRSGDRPGAVATDGPELDAPLLLFYGRENGTETRELYARRGSWTSVTVDTIRRLGYPHPRGDAYLVTTLRPLPAPSWIGAVDLGSLKPAGFVPGQPFSVSWLDVVLSTQ